MLLSLIVHVKKLLSELINSLGYPEELIYLINFKERFQRSQYKGMKMIETYLLHDGKSFHPY